MRASVEQVQQILTLFGVVEARRRRLDVQTLSREEASELLRKLSAQKRQQMVKTGGRPARPVDSLPAWQQRLISELAANPHDSRHGTQYGYGAGRCKCAPCRNAGQKRANQT